MITHPQAEHPARKNTPQEKFYAPQENHCRAICRIIVAVCINDICAADEVENDQQCCRQSGDAARDGSTFGRIDNDSAINMKRNVRTMRAAAIWAGLVAALCFSSASWADFQEKSFSGMVNKFALIPPGEHASKMLERATAAVNLIKKMELPEASRAINEALQLDIRNTYLHFLNGFIYHLQGRYGDTQKYGLAIEGYRQALKLDPGNWIAQEFLGLAFLDARQFDQAKGEFAGVLLMAPENTVSIYGLMVASYMTGDPDLACSMADQFNKLSRDANSEFIRTSVSVYASCGNFEKADLMRHKLGQLNDAYTDYAKVDQRLAQWKSLYGTRAESGKGANSNQGFIQASLTNALVNVGSATRVANGAPGIPAASAPASVAMPDNANDGTPHMVLIDVVMIATSELVSTSQGVNLLNALTLQLGSANAGAFSKTFNSAAVPGTETVITRAVTIPALSYSLNIANASNTSDAVLARPTLAAIEGLPSDFFSGTNMNAAVLSVSSLGSSSTIPVDKRFGVKLAVTPSFLSNGKIQLKVDAERTVLNPTVQSPGFAYRLDIAETTTNANVVMSFGDTLILSGLTEKAMSESRSGVPLLQNIPLVQYLFSTRNTVDYQHSVLLLITPRLPVYTSRASEIQSKNPALQALQEKLGFSVKSPSNALSILNNLKQTDLFREFQQSDVAVARWDRMSSTGERLKQVLGFLYY